MIHILAWYILPPILIVCIAMGVLADLLHGDLGQELNRAPWEKKQKVKQSSADGSFADGMITGVALDELDQMFKKK